MAREFVAQELPLDDLLRQSIGREIVEAGPALDFSYVPFADKVGNWDVPGESFEWVRLDDGSFWLIGPRSGKERYFLVSPARGEETT